uniref:Uncharacterized protein n=1 Tax=Ditylenchus dipsaci TaxID=166011 RepID=A0A915DXT2_9BILA
MNAGGVSSSTSLIVLIGLALSLLMGIVQCSRMDDELLIRNLFLKHYLQPKQTDDRISYTIPRQALLKYSQNTRQPAEANTNAYSSFWRGRRTPTLLANAPLPYSDYTPTPCRWKLCASLFRGSL